ncbi:MAG TPA: hypothetical protein VGG19_10210 [Tepidisphaeraceae bacterium]|jgi:Zn-dependent protease
MSESHVVTCGSCGQILPADALVCSRCGNFVYRGRLDYYASQATQLEAGNPAQAAAIWQQCLPLLPPNSPQYQNIIQRIAQLSQMQGQPLQYARPMAQPVRQPQNDKPGAAILKTLGSMVISAAIYAVVFGSLPLAIGFVILMLIHEMGHVFALWYYGLRASPPIFIPFVGAMINLRESPPDALAESVVGMGGPLLGSIGAILCLALAFEFPHYPVLINSAFLGIFLNLFNLLPVPPLDGGRITAALSPWLWLLGLILMAALYFYDLRQGVNDWLLLIIFFVALPRIRRTLQMRHQDLPYYQVPRKAAVRMGVLYVGLAVVLIGLLEYIRVRATLNF